MWNIVKTETQKINKDEIPPLKVDGNVVKDNLNLDNIFNTYFSTVTVIIFTRLYVTVNS